MEPEPFKIGSLEFRWIAAAGYFKCAQMPGMKITLLEDGSWVGSLDPLEECCTEQATPQDAAENLRQLMEVELDRVTIALKFMGGHKEQKT